MWRRRFTRGTRCTTGNGVRLKNVLDTMARYRMLAAVKDLLSLAIMVKHGGFLLDTTTLLGPSWKLQMQNTLNSPPDGPRVPCYPLGNGAGGKTMRPDDDSLDYTRMYPMGVPPDARAVNIPNFDVWGFCSPPGDALFQVALDSYLNRAMNAGLDKYPAVKMIGSKSANEFLTQDDREPRNSLIAGMSTTAIAQGLHKRAQQASKQVSDFGWEVVKKTSANGHLFPDGGAVFLPALGIHKVFGGSWRT